MARKLWSTGVSVHYGHGGQHDSVDFCGWWAELKYTTGGFCESGTVEGEIHTRYAEPTLQDAIQAVMEVADQFDIQCGHSGPMGGFSLYYKGDGEWPDYPPPDGWRETLITEAGRRGWTTYDHWNAPPILKD